MFRRKLHADADQKLRALLLIIRPNLSELHVTAWQCWPSHARRTKSRGAASAALFALSGARRQIKKPRPFAAGAIKGSSASGAFYARHLEKRASYS
jgi:hypothetical protein